MADYDFIYKSFVAGRLHPFYTDFYPGLLRYAARELGDVLGYLAEDCVQDAAMKTYLHRNELDTMDRWRSYLITTVHNRVVDLTRQAAMQAEHSDRLRLELDLRDEVETAAIEQEALDMIYAAVRQLPDDYRRIFELSFEQGMKNAEVAEKLCLAEITVKKRKARLLDRIRKALGRNIDEEYLILLLAIPASMEL